MEIVAYVIPLIAVFLSYVFGRLQSFQSDKRKILQERYDKFYVPYITLVYIFNSWSIRFSAMPQDARNKIQTLVLNNIEHIDAKTIEWVCQLYETNVWLDVTQEKNDNFGKIIHKRAGNELDEIYANLTISVIRHSILISRKLHRPKIAEHALTMFGESIHNQEIQPQVTR